MLPDPIDNPRVAFLHRLGAITRGSRHDGDVELQSVGTGLLDLLPVATPPLVCYAVDTGYYGYADSVFGAGNQIQILSRF